MTRDARFSVNFPVHLTWQEKSGGVKRMTGRCLNLSSEGMLIEVRDPLDSGTPVLAASDEFGRMGHTIVRHCRRDKMRYLAGLRFSTAFALSDPARQKILQQILSPV
jgi:hypothetical protein